MTIPVRWLLTWLLTALVSILILVFGAPEDKDAKTSKIERVGGILLLISVIGFIISAYIAIWK